MNAAELTGRTRTHVAAVIDAGVHLHVQVAAPFMNLRRRAQHEGIDLVAVSGFRDFERQLAIWNGKYRGEKPLYDAAGKLLRTDALAGRERVDAILHWSALPGASRHHWGTDVDLIDRRAIDSASVVKLTAAEYAPGGPFAPLAAWLEENAAQFGFFRPYRGIRSGVQPEPWHFSFAPLAEGARHALTPAILRDAIEAAPLLGKEHVMPALEELHARYVAAIDLP